MQELDLYKFVTENELEYHQYENDVILFFDNGLANEFCNLVGQSTFEDEGLEVVMKYGYICVHMYDICEMHGIDLDRVFEMKKIEQ